jgi:cation diffusion facilitator family transporter
MATSGGTKAVLAALFANLGIAIAKMVGFIITRSSSMLAESIHSAADTGNQALLLLGGRRASRPATPSHPFGHGRERYFWSFVVAIVLFTLGAGFALYEGIEKIRHPHAVDHLEWAVGILAIGIVLEGFSFRTAIVEANRVRGDLSWSRFVVRAKQPELPVVLLEDAGAMLGLVIAMAAVVLSDVTGEPRWDGVGTLTIGLLLAAIAVVLAREMKSLLIGEAANASDREAIITAITGVDAVVSLADLRTQHLGPDDILVGAKVVLRADLSTAGVVAAIDEIEAGVRAMVPTAHPIYVEPVEG